MSDEESTNSTVETLKFVGGSIKSAIKTVVVWTVAITPIATILTVWIAAFLQVIGFDVIAWAGLDSRYEAYLRISGAAITIVIIPALTVAIFLTKQDTITLRDVNPKSGDGGSYKLPKDRFETLTVKQCVGEDEDGEKSYEEVGKDQLHKINVKDGVGYEVDRYERDTNTAYVTWFAGLNPTDIRRHKSAIDYIETKYGALVDAAIDELANRTTLTREAAALEVNESIRTREDISLPSDAGIPDSPIQQAIEEHIDTDETPAYSDSELGVDNPTKQDSGSSESETHQQDGDEQ